MTEQTAPRIVHVALFTRNPRELAPFYRDVFNMKIVHTADAVQLWDGHVLLALNPWRGAGEEKLRIDEVGEPQAKGFDHFGFQIDDLEMTKTHLHANYPALRDLQATSRKNIHRVARARSGRQPHRSFRSRL